MSITGVSGGLEPHIPSPAPTRDGAASDGDRDPSGPAAHERGGSEHAATGREHGAPAQESTRESSAPRPATYGPGTSAAAGVEHFMGRRLDVRV